MYLFKINFHKNAIVLKRFDLLLFQKDTCYKAYLDGKVEIIHVSGNVRHV